MSATPEAPRIEKLEAAIRALAASVSAEPAAHINHEAEVAAILDVSTPAASIEHEGPCEHADGGAGACEDSYCPAFPAAPDTGIRVEREEIEIVETWLGSPQLSAWTRPTVTALVRRWLTGESR